MKYSYFGSEVVKIDEKYAYHYCSLDAFFGIIESKSFWLTTLDSTNDTTETKIAKGIIKKSLNEFCLDTNNSIEVNKEKLNLISEMISINQDYSHKNTEYFSFSMSILRDNMLMWNRYDKDFKGICIKIDLNELCKILHVDLLKGGSLYGMWLYITQIMYKENDQIEIVKDYINSNFDRYQMFESSNKQYIVDFLRNTYNFFCPMLKHNDFKEEGEIRILILKGIAEKFINEYSDIKFMTEKLSEYIIELGMNESNLKFKNFNNNIKAYYSLKLDKIWGSKLIKEVILGKNSDQSIDELRRFLDYNNLKNTKISNSKIIYKK